MPSHMGYYHLNSKYYWLNSLWIWKTFQHWYGLRVCIHIQRFCLGHGMALQPLPAQRKRPIEMGGKKNLRRKRKKRKGAETEMPLLRGIPRHLCLVNWWWPMTTCSLSHTALQYHNHKCNPTATKATNGEQQVLNLVILNKLGILIGSAVPIIWLMVGINLNS